MAPRIPVAAALIALAAPSVAQITNPADAAQGQSAEQQQEMSDLSLEGGQVSSSTVVGRRVSQYREEDRIGSYDQPRWTGRRLFPATRVYVRPSGSMELEHWTRVMVPRESGQTTVENQYELEFGLPGRFQVDLYAVSDKTGSEGELNFTEQKFELRYALADWGDIWMNPTLYFEYAERDLQADKVEYKVLLGDELAPGWHFGANLVLEHELSDALENEWGVTTGVSHVMVDERFSLGAEVKAALTDVHADRGNYDKSLEIGPSLRWRPNDRLHVDFAPLIGIGGDSRAADIYLVVGLDI